MLDLSKHILLASVYICSVLASEGVSSDQWDPLPAGVRSVVSTNHLSETSPPQVFAEYHALLPDYRGDYGVRSALVDAASEEPVYKGAETLLLPLYIPHGAIPLAVNERRERSGKVEGIANMKVMRGPSPSVRGSSSVNRPVRRVITPIRRPPSGSRPFPTPPASYLRTWSKKRNGSVLPSAEEDDIEEARKSKQRLLTQMSNFKKRMESSSSPETTTPAPPLTSTTTRAPSTVISTPSSRRSNKENLRIKKIATMLENRFNSKISTSENNILESTTSSLLVPTTTTPATSPKPLKILNNKIIANSSFESKKALTEIISRSKVGDVLENTISFDNVSNTSTFSPGFVNVSSTTPNYPFVSNFTNSLPSSNKVTTISSTTTARTTEQTTTKIVSPPLSDFGGIQGSKDVDEIDVKSIGSSLSRRRPVFMAKPKSTGKNEVPPNQQPAKLDRNETLINSTALFISKSTTETPVTTPTTERNLKLKRVESPASKNSTSKAPFLVLRRRIAGHKNFSSKTLPSKINSKEEKSQTHSIIDRVLSSTTTNQTSNNTLNYKNRRNETDLKVEIPSVKQVRNAFYRSSTLPNNSTKLNDTQVNPVVSDEGRLRAKGPRLSSQNSHFKSSFPRQKVPLRVRRPIVSNPIKQISSTTPTPITTSSTNTTTHALTPTTPANKETVRPKGDFIVVHSSDERNRNLEKIPYIQFTRRNHVTSTPKVPYTFPPRVSTTSSLQHTSKYPLKKIKPSVTDEKQNISTPNSEVSSRLHAPKMKSPQDIVLEKLSELMKNATKGNRDNLSLIVQEIEKLNKELASMGIHIIDAEFGGQKIKLKDQVIANRSGINLSGATTIRYLIPNTKNKTNIRNLNPQIINHQPTSRTITRSGTSEYNTDKRNTSNEASSKSALPFRPDGSYFILRHHNNSNFGHEPPPPSSTPPSSYPTTETSTKRFKYQEPISRELPSVEENLPGAIREPYLFEKENLWKGIRATTTISSRESTRTRSTTIAVDVLQTEQTTSNPLTSNVLKPVSYTYNGQNIYEHSSTTTTVTVPAKDHTSVNPTAHRRPTASEGGVELDISKSTTSPANQTLENTGSQNSTEVKIIDGFEKTVPLVVSEYETVVSKEIPDEPVAEDANSYIYLIGILGIIPCMAALAILYKQRKQRERKSLPEREERAEGGTPPVTQIRSTGHNDTLDAFPGYIFEASPNRDSRWELSRSKLRLTSVIGEGNFGIVWKAEARNLCDWDENGGPTVLVAVKGVKEGAGTKEKNDLLRELSIMQHLGQHTNIVTLLGCCTTHEPYHLVMEYVMFGKLLTFLREQRSKSNYFNFSSDSDHLTSRDLTKFASQIATGCEYLQSRGVIHRDLAARNILVDHKKICKIADFGLARSVKDMDSDIYEQKSRGPLPIRWMAPESLFMNIFTHKSDVWSFGILCWEIVTLGSTPYPGISAREVMRRVREGYRLERPEHCRTEFYRIVTKCWHQDLNKRASFSTVKEELRDLLENPSGWIDLENFQESTYYSMHENNDEKL